MLSGHPTLEDGPRAVRDLRREAAMSNVHYVPANSRFMRGQWRVWCFDILRGHYWGFQGDSHAVAPRGERKHRKVADVAPVRTPAVA